MKSREFRPGDIVKILDEGKFGRVGYDGPFVVVRCHYIPNTFPEEDYDYEEDYKPQTRRESCGHSQQVELRVSRRFRHRVAFKVFRRWRNRKTIRYSGKLLQLISRKN